MKYAIKIAYDGGYFSGWQKQPGRTTVQESVGKALKAFCHQDVSVHGAGRTDKGVHALGQVASFELKDPLPLETIISAGNAHLPDQIRLMEAAHVDESFHARYSALWREYVYHVWTGASCYPHIRNYVWWKRRADWDMEKVRSACGKFTGTHDFRAFCRASECPQNAVRYIARMTVAKRGPLVRFRIRGNAFLTNMVRIMIGTTDHIAAGACSLEILDYLLSGANREEAGPTAPAQGLILQKIGYGVPLWPSAGS